MKIIDIYLTVCPDKVDQQKSHRLFERIVLHRYGKEHPTRREHSGGKPYFTDSEDTFSPTHTRNFYGVAFCKGQEVGLDMESVGKTNSLRVARRFFTLREQEALLKEENPEPLFYRLWTKKEALIKCTGEGIGALTKTPELEKTLWHTDISLELQELTGDQNLFGTVASEKVCEIRFHMIEAE